jgi:protein-disulfide isomerase
MTYKEKSMRLKAFLLSVVLFAAPMAVQAQSLNEQQKTEMGEVIRAYLLEHPELLREMAEKLEAKEREAEQTARVDGLAKNKDTIFKLAGDAIVGNPAGDVTVIEFMDYNCGWCKKSVKEVASLIAADPKLKVVMKEFPIFGEHSEFAARAALASKKQNKYWEFHQAMLEHEGQLTSDGVKEIAKAMGLDVAKLEVDMKAPEVLDTIAANYDLAKALALNGTPAFIIDTNVVPGYIPQNDIQAYVAEVRANGCKYC